MMNGNVPPCARCARNLSRIGTGFTRVAVSATRTNRIPNLRAAPPPFRVLSSGDMLW
jgi:hypothetical protein